MRVNPFQRNRNVPFASLVLMAILSSGIGSYNRNLTFIGGSNPVYCPKRHDKMNYRQHQREKQKRKNIY